MGDINVIIVYYAVFIKQNRSLDCTAVYNSFIIEKKRIGCVTLRWMNTQTLMIDVQSSFASEMTCGGVHRCRQRNTHSIGRWVSV